MIFSLRGKAQVIRPFFAIVECGGVGYGVKIPLETSQQLATQKKEVLLHTRTIVRENAQEIYGFLTAAEADLFDFLRELHGIGPTMSLNLISTFGSQTLLQVLLSGDVAALQQAPKVGKTRADKIIFEAHLREKKLKTLANELGSDTREVAAADKNNELREKLYEALQSLGFQPKEIEKAEAQIARQFPQAPVLSEENLQEWIRLYLRCL